jgi:hypothetical protein
LFLGRPLFKRKTIRNPITSPITLENKVKNALTAISIDPSPIPMPVTVADGRSATAIATPTIISGRQ